MGGRGSAGLSFFLIALVVAFVLVVIYFDLERQFLGFRYTEWMWNLLKDVTMSIPRMLERMLDSVRNA